MAAGLGIDLLLSVCLGAIVGLVGALVAYQFYEPSQVRSNKSPERERRSAQPLVVMQRSLAAQLMQASSTDFESPAELNRAHEFALERFEPSRTLFLRRSLRSSRALAGIHLRGATQRRRGWPFGIPSQETLWAPRPPELPLARHSLYS